MKRLAVFCASSESGLDPDHIDIAHELARQCALNGVTIVHGGSDTGLMKHLTLAARSFGGKVEGVMCKSLAAGRFNASDFDDSMVALTYLHRISEVLFRASAIAVLPGGIGTLHELLTAIILKHIGEADQRLVLVNSRGYWDRVIGLLGLSHGSSCGLYHSDTGHAGPQHVHILEESDPIRLGALTFSSATGLPAAPLPWETPDGVEESLQAERSQWRPDANRTWLGSGVGASESRSPASGDDSGPLGQVT